MRNVLLLACTLMATGCGFHLRQELSLPETLVALRVETADPYSPLQRNLEQALRRAGANIADTAGSSGVLRVFVSSIDRLPLSVGGTGRVQEYLLRYTVEVELIDIAGAVVLPRVKLELERDYTFDTTQAFGTPGEEEVVRAELERDMVQAILRRIDAVTHRAN